jgi:hypothetical protein
MEEYKTRDLRLAASLQSLGHNIIKLEDHPEKDGTKLFVFENKKNHDGDTPEEDASKFLRRELRIEPNTLFHNNANLREWVKNNLSLK